MIKTLFACLAAFAVTSAQARFEVDPKVSSFFVKDTLDRLPPTMLKELREHPRTIKISYASLMNPPEAQSRCLRSVPAGQARAIKPLIFGRTYGFPGGDIKVELANLFEKDVAVGPVTTPEFKSCHGSPYGLAQATLLHELLHAYDQLTKGRARSHEAFLNLAGFSPRGFLGRRAHPVINEASRLDPYEDTNIGEYVAVNFEHYLLDPEFACRQPATHSKFVQFFEYDPHPQRSCRPSMLVPLVEGESKRLISIDPSNVAEIHHILAGTGPRIESRLGHSLFRIITRSPRLDVTVGLVGLKADLGQSSMVDGVTGKMPAALVWTSLLDMKFRYNEEDFRDLSSFPLSLTDAEKQEFLEVLAEQSWTYHKGYQFLSNNCATGAAALLRASLEGNSGDELEKKFI